MDVLTLGLQGDPLVRLADAFGEAGRSLTLDVHTDRTPKHRWWIRPLLGRALLSG
jgi:hypothetical protein